MQTRLLPLSGLEKIGLVTVALGAVTVLGVALSGIREGFWVPYADGFRVSGWMLLGIGILWLIFSAARGRTQFFALDRRIDADKFGLSIAALGLAVVVAIFVVLPRLPATKDAALPMDPNVRQQVITMERNLRYFVSMALVVSGLAVGAFPAIRFFRK